jgi:predicted transcriptional regulator
MLKKEQMMERPKLTPEKAELIINCLRNNPGVSMRLSDIADGTGLPVEDIAAYMEELAERPFVVRETTPNGFDVYRFPDELQRGTMAPSNAYGSEEIE